MEMKPQIRGGSRTEKKIVDNQFRKGGAFLNQPRSFP